MTISQGMRNEEALSLIARRSEAMPMAAWLNYQVSADGDMLLHRLGFAETHIGNAIIRALHGGVIAAFLELAAQLEVSAAISKSATLSTVNIETDYLRSSEAADMHAKVDITRMGRRVVFAEAIGWQSDRSNPVAQARICFRTLSE